MAILVTAAMRRLPSSLLAVPRASCLDSRALKGLGNGFRHPAQPLTKLASGLMPLHTPTMTPNSFFQLIPRVNNQSGLVVPTRQSTFGASHLVTFSTSCICLQQPENGKQQVSAKIHEMNELDSNTETNAFLPSAKAATAAQVNLTARLSREKEGEKGMPEMGSATKLLRLGRPYLKALLAASVLILISAGSMLAIPTLYGEVINQASKNKEAEPHPWGYRFTHVAIGFGIFVTVAACANLARLMILRTVSESIVAQLRTSIYRRVYAQDAEFFDANRVGDLLSRISSDSLLIGKTITSTFTDGIRAGCYVTAGTAAMCWISPSLTGVMVVSSVPLAITAMYLGRFSKKITRQIQDSLGSLSKVAEERIGNAKLTQAFVAEVQEVRRFNSRVRKIYSLGRREALFQGSFLAFWTWTTHLNGLGLLVICVYLVRQGAMEVGDIVKFVGYALLTVGQMVNLSSIYNDVMRAAGAASRIFEILEREPASSNTKGLRMDSALGLIKFEKVTFAYPTRPAVAIFQGLDFEIPAGSNVCIVGPSGGGKSTIAWLLTRFYLPASGKITINGVDISKVNAKSLRKRIGIVPQEPVLLLGTVRSNITYGVPKATEQEIILAAKNAGCNFIQDLPLGLDAQVGPRGSQVSGGQKQRLALARALIKRPDILIMDEATSALDAESETLVNQALASLLDGKMTIITIAHRLSTIKRANIIIVLGRDGRVAETGTFNELSANPNSSFTKLMESQLGLSDFPRVSISPVHDVDGDENDASEGAYYDLEDAEDYDGEGRKKPL